MDARVKPAQTTSEGQQALPRCICGCSSPQGCLRGGSSHRAPGPAMRNTPKNQAEKSFVDGKIVQGVQDAVCVITFNNPDKLNAMALDMWEWLGRSLLVLM